MGDEDSLGIGTPAMVGLHEISGGACSVGSDDAGAMIVEDDGMDVAAVQQIHQLMRNASEKMAGGERWSGAQAAERVRELDRICSEIVKTEADSLAGSLASSCRGSEMGNSPREWGSLGDKPSEPKRTLAGMAVGSPLAGSSGGSSGLAPPRPFLSTMRRGRGSSKMVPPTSVHPGAMAHSGRLASGRVSKGSTGSHGDVMSESVLSENRCGARVCADGGGGREAGAGDKGGVGLCFWPSPRQRGRKGSRVWAMGGSSCLRQRERGRKERGTRAWVIGGKS
jgi:hypothetical protein